MIESISKYLNIATLKKASIIAAIAFVGAIVAAAGEGNLFGPDVSLFVAGIVTALLIQLKNWLATA